MNRKIILITAFCAFATLKVCTAETILKQVIILNEGPFGGPVTIGSYNPATKTYQDFATINARFASDVLIDNGFIYVAADHLLLKYDLQTKQLLDSQEVAGIRELAVWKNQILVTRAETPTLSSWFQVYDKNSLDFIYELTSVSERCSEVKVLGDTAYLAVNGWGTVGKLAVVDLNNELLNREIDLGADGLNPENVIVDKTSGKIFTVNNLDWTDASVTDYDVASAGYVTNRMHRSSGCSGSSYYNGNIFFQTSGENKVGVYSTVSSTVWDSILVNKSVYGMEVDEVNAHLYISETDYTSYGKVFVFDLTGAVIDSFDVQVSPGTFAFDYEVSTGFHANAIVSNQLSVYPNPATDEAHIFIPGKNNEAAHVTLLDVTGKKAFEKNMLTNVAQVISLGELAKGIYFLKVETETQIYIQKIIHK